MWPVAVLWFACFGFALWCLLAILGEDWSRPVVASLSSLVDLIRYGATAVVCGMAAHRPGIPRPRPWLRCYLAAWLITAIQSFGSVAGFVLFAFRGHAIYPLLLEGIAFGILLVLATRLVPFSVRLISRPFDGPNGPGPFAPA
jgi:hypothetical protein